MRDLRAELALARGNLQELEEHWETLEPRLPLNVVLGVGYLTSAIASVRGRIERLEDKIASEEPANEPEPPEVA